MTKRQGAEMWMLGRYYLQLHFKITFSTLLETENKRTEARNTNQESVINRQTDTTDIFQ